MTNGELSASSHLGAVEGSRAHTNAKIADMSATTTAPDLSVSDCTRSNIGQGPARTSGQLSGSPALKQYDSVPAAYYNGGHGDGHTHTRAAAEHVGRGDGLPDSRKSPVLHTLESAAARARVRRFRRSAMCDVLR